MKWLNLDLIKAQLRIDPDFILEDDLLRMYGDSAEELVQNVCNRTTEGIVEQYGNVPTALKHAALMIVDLSYQYRSPVSMNNMSIVPYTFDILVKPYIKLT